MVADLLTIVFLSGVCLGLAVAALLWMTWDRRRDEPKARERQVAEWDPDYWWNNGRAP